MWPSKSKDPRASYVIICVPRSYLEKIKEVTKSPLLGVKLVAGLPRYINTVTKEIIDFPLVENKENTFTVEHDDEKAFIAVSLGK